MIQYLIVDDEPQARHLLQAYMKNIASFQLIKLCENALEAYEALHTQQVDLLFLDINMPIISGLDFLRSLKNPPLVIFTTAYPTYAVDGFDLNVVDYLLKPISLSRLMQALDKVRAGQVPAATVSRRPAQTETYLFVKADNKLIKLNLVDIQFVESMQNYVKLHLGDRVLVASYTMKAIEERLPTSQFIRIHRSYIVPIAAITAINGNIVETIHRAFPIGANYRDEINKLISR